MYPAGYTDRARRRNRFFQLHAEAERFNAKQSEWYVNGSKLIEYRAVSSAIADVLTALVLILTPHLTVTEGQVA